MAKRLGTSRTPVVYALHKLQTEGLLDSVPNTGFFVHRVTVKELVDLFAIREALDAAIVDDLVDKVTEEQIEKLAVLFKDFSTKESIDSAEYREADIAFHRMLMELTDNEIAKRVNENFLILDRSFTVGLVRPAEETLREHLEIIAALRDRNGERAKSLMIAHINITRTMLRDTVRSLRHLRIDPATIPIDQVDLAKDGGKKSGA